MKLALRKYCPKCTFMVDEEKFLAGGSWCADCRKKAVTAWHRKNPEKSKAIRKRKYAKLGPRGKQNRRRYKLKYLYDLTVEQFNVMVEEQNGLCKICNKPPVKWLCVDHCHKTKVIRGLLCDRCNTVIGRMGDDPALLRSAAEYLESFQ